MNLLAPALAVDHLQLKQAMPQVQRQSSVQFVKTFDKQINKTRKPVDLISNVSVVSITTKMIVIALISLLCTSESRSHLSLSLPPPPSLSLSPSSLWSGGNRTGNLLIPTNACRIFMCPNNGIRLPVFRILTSAQMWMHAIAHRGSANTVGESALKVDFGKKNPLPHRGLEPASVWRLTVRRDALCNHCAVPLPNNGMCKPSASTCVYAKWCHQMQSVKQPVLTKSTCTYYSHLWKHLWVQVFP